MEKKKLIVLMTILISTISVIADKYKVLYVNSADIKVENKRIATGNVFSDTEKIIWTNDQQAMKVFNLNTKRTTILTAKALKKKNASTLYEYLTNTRHLSTREYNKRKTLEEWQIDSTLYLLDTLYLTRPNIAGNDIVANIIDNQGNKIELPISSDKKSYIITKDIYEHFAPYIHKFVIRECDRDRGWEYDVYRRLIIETVPMK